MWLEQKALLLKNTLVFEKQVEIKTFSVENCKSRISVSCRIPCEWLAEWPCCWNWSRFYDEHLPVPPGAAVIRSWSFCVLRTRTSVYLAVLAGRGIIPLSSSWGAEGQRQRQVSGEPHSVSGPVKALTFCVTQSSILNPKKSFLSRERPAAKSSRGNHDM